MGLIGGIVRRRARVTSIRPGDGRDPPGTTIAYVRTRGVGRRLNERLCRMALQRDPAVRADWSTVEIVEQWRVPLRWHTWKVRYRER